MLFEIFWQEFRIGLRVLAKGEAIVHARVASGVVASLVHLFRALHFNPVEALRAE